MSLPVFTAEGGRVRMDGSPLHLKGVSWFGTEGEGLAPDGLWVRPMGEYLDYLLELGVNAVRVPLAVDSVLANPPLPEDSIKWEPRLRQARCAVLAPRATLGAGPTQPASAWSSLTHTQARHLDALDRLILLCAKRGLLVLLDMHRLAAKVSAR